MKSWSGSNIGRHKEMRLLVVVLVVNVPSVYFRPTN